MKYLLNTPSITKKEKSYVKDVLDSSWLSINGKHTKIFEKKFRKYIGCKFSTAVQSGTAALHVALESLKLKRGSKVIVPNYTCVSNLSATTQSNLTPLLVDIELDTLGLNFNEVKKAIKIHKPKALQLVHVYGFPARDTGKILNLCKKKGIIVIEDCSESLGATINKKKVGGFGDISIFSIRSEKMIGVGEGGMILTNNKKFYKNVLFYASRSAPFRAKKDPYWKKYYSIGVGYNYLMPHLLGAVGRAQIERFEKEILKKKIYVGKEYRKIFTSGKFEFTQKILKGFKPVYWLNSIKFKNINQKKVNKIGIELINKGIEVRSGFWPLSGLPKFKSIKFGNMKNSKEIFSKTLVLPSNISLKVRDIKKIINILNNLINKN